MGGLQDTKNELIVVLLGLFGACVGATVAVRRDPCGVGVVVVWHRRTLDQANSDTCLVSLNNTRDFCREPDVDASRLEVFLPFPIELAELGEYNHGRKVASNAQLITRVPHAVCRTRAQALEDDTGYIGRFVSGSEEESNHGHGDGVGELF